MKNSPYQHLLQHIKTMDHAVVAFSGGVDSSLLAYVAHQALGDDMVAITIDTPYIPAWEIDAARVFAAEHNIAHEIMQLPTPANIRHNPPDRCYLCKKELFTALQRRAKKIAIDTIIEGSNLDDLGDYRPGMRALGELNIVSPLLELGIDKETIRSLSRELGLATWNKPASACLLSRIPYHTVITPAELARIAGAETVLRHLNISGSRVRSHGDIARIEVPIEGFADLLQHDVRRRLIKQIKACGYTYVTLDLEGYQTGSLNKTLAKNLDY
ncbi:ATP-dependent sacrificial sulfur transferase LarE [Desulfocastanea catecholica]